MIKEIKEIRLEKMLGRFYVSKCDDTHNRYELLDEELKYICSIYTEDINSTLKWLENICNISDLEKIGYCRSIIWGGDLEELYEEFLEATNENEDNYTYNEFIENIPINSIGNKSIYFVVDLEDF